MEGSEHGLVALAAVLVLGTAGQWIAWKVRLPSILLLLTLGVIAGPVTGLVQPDAMLGSLLFPVVSLSVAIILFEGSLSLKLRELREIGGVLISLLTVGVLVAWVLISLSAYTILDFSPFKSILLGAVLVVTGPTVIGPLLRHVRPVGRVGPIARWEGIVIDPVGAVLAVLVFEAHLAASNAGVETASWSVFGGLVRTIVLGGGIGALAAWIVGQIIKRHMTPDYLQSPVVLMFVLAAFVASNLVQHESGLLAVTVMGVVLTNLKGVAIHQILEFKENLSVLLVSSLFILLAARLNLDTFSELGWRGVLFVLMLILIVRPASVFLSSLRSRLSLKERIFLSWMAPRGIVAAAVASVFAIRLEHESALAVPAGPAAVVVATATDDRGDVEERVEESLLDAPGSGLVPATFMVIFGTVVVYGLSAAPLARYLGLASVNPQGVLIAGANSVARQIAAALQSAGYAVLLVDRNPANIRLACMEGLRTVWDDILSESAVEDLDLGGIGRFLGMTPNAEVNSLGAMQMIPLFGRSGVFQLPTTDAATERDHAPNHLRARTLFNGTLSHAELERQFVQGARLKTTRLSDEFTYNDFLTEYGGAAIPLFISEQGKLTILTTDSKPSPKSGQTLISLVNVVPQRDLAKRGSERSKS